MSAVHYLAVYPLGDCAVTVELDRQISLHAHRKVRCLSTHLDQNPIPGMIEYVPSYTHVTIYYDIKETAAMASGKPFASGEWGKPYDVFCAMVKERLGQIELTENEETAHIELPVCYGGEFGPDLAFVAEINGLSPEEVIQIHTGREYLVYMIGFAPGFPYLGGLSERIASPRRETPRIKIPAGTVGIAGMQTGVYPLETPGGWQCIGRTPIRLFRPQESPPVLLRSGSVVKFIPISRDEYDRLDESKAQVDAPENERDGSGVRE